MSLIFPLLLILFFVGDTLWLVRARQRVRQQPLYQILFAAAALVAIAQMADIFELQQSFLVFLEEVLELNAALGLVVASVRLQRYDRRQQQLCQPLAAVQKSFR